MSKYSVLHVFNNEIKFSKAFFEFLHSNNFDLSKHSLFQYSKKDPEYENFNMPIVFSSLYSITNNIKLLILMFKHDKLILHNLASPWLLLYLFLFPKLTKKVYWVIWGKDLYFYKLLKKKYLHHKIYEFFRRKVFKKIQHVISNFEGDYKLAQEWYGTHAKFHNCFMYPSNLFKEQIPYTHSNTCISLLIGNSADPSNNHLEVFSRIKNSIEKKVNIYVPLSYGNKKYAQKIIVKGRELFGDSFHPITQFLPYKKYIKLLSTIDIAIFAHNRQQAVGNIVTLLGSGKKVYLKNNTSHHNFFQSHAVTLYDLNQFNLELIPTEIASKNTSIIKSIFSKETLKKDLEGILK